MSTARPGFGRTCTHVASSGRHAKQSDEQPAFSSRPGTAFWSGLHPQGRSKRSKLLVNVPRALQCTGVTQRNKQITYHALGLLCKPRLCSWVRRYADTGVVWDQRLCAQLHSQQ